MLSRVVGLGINSMPQLQRLNLAGGCVPGLRSRGLRAGTSRSTPASDRLSLLLVLSGVTCRCTTTTASRGRAAGVCLTATWGMQVSARAQHSTAQHITSSTGWSLSGVPAET